LNKISLKVVFFCFFFPFGPHLLPHTGALKNPDGILVSLSKKARVRFTMARALFYVFVSALLVERAG
jgi:hypothetical protein